MVEDGSDTAGDNDDVVETYDRMTALREEVANVEAQSEGGHRQYYEWPATRDLLPDVSGKRVLDAGCGNGDYSRWLVERGASVVGVDFSERSVERARDQASGDAEFRCHDLREPLTFADDEFDLVLSQLALDHVETWEPVFREFARVLRPSGHFVCSVGNPVFDFLQDDAAVYYDVERIDQPWGGLDCHDYRRPFSAVVTPLLDAGFRLERLEEPRPQLEYETATSENFEPHRRVPRYLCVRARLPPE